MARAEHSAPHQNALDVVKANYPAFYAIRKYRHLLQSEGLKTFRARHYARVVELGNWSTLIANTLPCARQNACSKRPAI